MLTSRRAKCDVDVVSRDADDNDPFLEADNLQELSRLIEKTDDDGCSSSEFVSGDDDLPVCMEWMMITGKL